MEGPKGEGIRRLAAAELERRRDGNPGYSLRAFAASLGIDHGTLSRLLRGVRSPGPDAGRRLSAALLPDRDSLALLRLIESGPAIADSRAAGAILGISTDRVNVALQRLCADGQVRMEGDRWLIAS
jgi:hypothetical protein